MCLPISYWVLDHRRQHSYFLHNIYYLALYTVCIVKSKNVNKLPM